MASGRGAKGTSTDTREGHGDDSPIPGVRKGTFIDGGGTYVPLSESPYSTNKKTGFPSDKSEQ